MTQRFYRVIIVNLALAGLYFAFGKLGLSLAFVNPSATPVWPPSGLALAALLLKGYWLWPGIFVGAFLVNITTQGSILTTLGIATGNTLEAIAGAWLVARFARGPNAFDRAGSILRFVILAAFLSTLVSATVGVNSLCLGGLARWREYGPIWLTWWLGDMVSDLVVAPLILIWATLPCPPLSRRGSVEAAAALSLVFVVGTVVFFGWNSFPVPSHSLEYLAVPPLLWAAFRFEQRGAVTSAFIISGMALWTTRHASGPFSTGDPNQALLLLQIFVGTITVTALVLAAVVSERRRATQRLHVQDAVSRVLAEARTLKEATPRIVQALCESAGWDVGAIWDVSRTANELRCVEVWHPPGLSISEFKAATKSVRFQPGIGLPGRVWSSGSPAWIRDVTTDGNFSRGEVAAREGLHGAVCFPLKFGNRVVGMIECFSREILDPDADLLPMLADIGNQLGQFIERQRAEEGRHRMEKLKGAILDSALDAIISMDQDGRILEFNPSAEKTFGYRRAEVLSCDMVELIIPARLRAEHRQAWQGYLIGGASQRVGQRTETTAQHADGREFPIELSINVVHFGDEKIFTATLRDISEPRAAADKLASSQREEQLRRAELETLMRAVPAIVWIAHDPECHHISGNEAGREFLRLGPGQNLSKTAPDGERPTHFRVFRHGRLLSDEELPMQMVARTGQPIWGEELEERFSDGTIRWLYGNVVPLRNESGSVRGVLATFVDITERKLAEEVRAKLAAIVEFSDDAIISKSLEGLVLSWNRGAEKVLGYSAAEMVGQPISRLIPPDRQGEEAQILARLRQGRAVDRYETLRLTKDGRCINVSLTISPIRDASGTVVAASKILQDITDRKKTEKDLEDAREALRAHAANLERTVAERTRELRETITEVESFSYSISHDMRGPLRAIQGYASVLEEELAGKINGESLEYLQRIGNAAARLTRLVQDILSYSQISRSRLELAPIDLHALLLEVIEHNPNFQPPVTDLHIENPLPMVLGHEVALTQIYANLLGNAVKFVFPGTVPRVRVGAQRQREFARVWITDNGIGIDPKNHDRIFQMFERLNSPKDYDGTGIGLALVKKAIERMGGRLGVESELGKGARFWFELRCVE